MKILKMNFNKKLILTCFVVVTLLSSILTASSYLVAVGSLRDFGISFLNNTVDELYYAIDVQSQVLQKLLKSESQVLLSKISQEGGVWVDRENGKSVTVYNQDNMFSESIEIPDLMIGHSKFWGNYSLVDSIRNTSGSFATVFQLLPGKLLRVSTNIVKSNGERAVNTYIPSSSPVYKTVVAGEPYYGRATVMGEELLTAYVPVKDSVGKIIAVVFTGVKILSPEFKKLLSDVHIAGRGYAFVYDSKGNILVHPSSSGLNFKKTAPKVWNVLKGVKDGLVSYDFKGDKRNCSIKYFEPWDWNIAVSLTDKKCILGLTQGFCM